MGDTLTLTLSQGERGVDGRGERGVDGQGEREFLEEAGDERGGCLRLLPCREVARVVHDREPRVRRAVGERLAVGARKEAVVRAPDDERRRAHAVEASGERGVDVAGLPDEARRHALVADGGLLVHVRRACGVVEEEGGPFVLPQHEVVGRRVAAKVDAGRADGDERGSGSAAYGGLDGEPSAEACADDGGRGECVGEVGDGEREVVDRVGSLGAFAAAEAGQLGRDDLEAFREQVEERRPR